MVDHGAKSIHDLDPLESGGTAARQGFLFQDHVAARFCLEMLVSGPLKSVWCETLDDVTLIWKTGHAEVVEFVQVKAEKLDQLWSVPRLCARESRNGRMAAGTSVLERLLENDRCTEPCKFRMVSRRPVVEALRVLETEVGAQARAADSEKMKSLCETLEQRLDGIKSPNKHGPTWWAENTVWEIGHSEEALRNRNLSLVGKVVDEFGRFLVSDQREQLYELLLMKVKAAADADKSLNRDGGKLARDTLIDWFGKQIRELERGGSEAGGIDLRVKLEAARIPADTVDSAEELRRSYLSRWLRPSYLERDLSRAWEDRVRAELVELRSRLDSGEIEADGVDFHRRSLEALEKVRAEATKGKELPKDFFQGCMYYITDLCQHRFLRARV
jgi:hypothetical protein